MSYWQERAEQSIKRMENRLNDDIPELVDSFNHAKRELTKEINSFYGRYAKENKISLADAQRQLSFNELKEFKGDLKSFKELSYNSIGKYNLELNNLSVKARITRLQALEFQCDSILQGLYQQMKAKVEQTVTEIYTEQFYRSQFDLYQYTGFQHAFAKVNEEAIKRVLATPVQGADISTRLWRQDIDTGFKIRQTLNTMFITGKPPQYFADELQKVIGNRNKDGNLTGKKYEAYRLLYNESSFAVTQADLEAYKIDDVEEYEIVATLDLITSSICREMDSKRFPVEKAVVGVNCPPLHVNCRSTTAPYFSWVKGGERVARDKDGKNVTVENMNYDEWKAKYIDKDSANGIIKVGRDKMKVDVVIDNFTPCLIENSTGNIVNTEMMQIKLKKQDYKGYNFDWSIPLRNGYEVFALKITNDDTIQGLIAQKVESDNKAVHIDIVETAPHNYGSNGKYNGVGAHLFAHACKTAYDNNYSYVYFDAKTNLIDYYKEKLGAEQLGKSQRMLIEGEAFMKLINTYYGRE